MEFIKANLWEIKKSSAISTFGTAIALGHILIFLIWSMQDGLPLRLAAESTPMCWPIMNNCNFWLGMPEGLFKFIYYAYVFFAASALLCFLFTRISGLAWFFLSLCFLCFLTVYFRDYRLSSNEHYFWLLLSFFFLFIPNKENMLRIFIVSYWIAWGIIRLKPEWMTGIWILDHFPMPVKLAEWLAAMSTLIMMILPLGLLFRDGRYLAVSSLTLIGLNIFLWSINDFFSPSLNLCALSLFIFMWFEKRKMERDYIYQSFIRPEPSRLWVILILGLFWIGQFSPNFSDEHPVLRPLQETVALTPLKAIDECKAVAFAQFPKEIRQIDTDAMFSTRSEDLKCHPHLNFMEFRKVCNDHKDEGLTNLHVSFYKRGFKDIVYKKIFESDDICAADVTLMKAMGSNGL